MPIDLAGLAPAGRTAVLTMELQRGVVGDLAPMPALARAVADRSVVANTARLLRAARSGGARVVHCLAGFRADHAGSSFAAPMLARALARGGLSPIAGTPNAELVSELGPEPGDLLSTRVHGFSPFTATSLDVWLRNLGVTTVVATGVSLNLGIIGTCLEAVNLGYTVVVPTDAVCGIPKDYADAVLTNTIAAIAHLTTVEALIAAWTKS